MKNIYPFHAGGDTVYFGRGDEVPYKDAQRQFTEHVKSLSDGTYTSNSFTAAELVERFLTWISEHRGYR
ncbi:MAG: hypothetical protein KDA66_21505, partial [Planctomycetaceae bacterium]|nr:hypothetical protein [Planctomycetaceae bacterium]